MYKFSAYKSLILNFFIVIKIKFKENFIKIWIIENLTMTFFGPFVFDVD